VELVAVAFKEVAKFAQHGPLLVKLVMRPAVQNALLDFTLIQVVRARYVRYGLQRVKLVRHLVAQHAFLQDISSTQVVHASYAQHILVNVEPVIQLIA